MALFTDIGAITISDLLQYENRIAEVASDHDINVDTKIALALSGTGNRLLTWLLNIGASDPQFITRRALGLSTVVLTDALRRWIVFESLSGVFAEAFNLQLNTRFQGKMIEYQQQASSAAEYAFQSGIGIVFAALPTPATPLVSVQTGTLGAVAIYTQTSWVDAKGGESAPSPINGLVLPSGSSISAAMAEGSLAAPAAAVGWNVYVALDQSSATRQNLAPLNIGSTWQLPVTGITSGSGIGQGQMPNFFIRTSKQVLRG